MLQQLRRSNLDYCTQKVQPEGTLSPVDGFASTYAVLKTLSPLFSMAALRSEGSGMAEARARQRMHCLSLHPIQLTHSSRLGEPKGQARPRATPAYAVPDCILRSIQCKQLRHFSWACPGGGGAPPQGGLGMYGQLSPYKEQLLLSCFLIKQAKGCFWWRVLRGLRVRRTAHVEVGDGDDVVHV